MALYALLMLRCIKPSNKAETKSPLQAYKFHAKNWRGKSRATERREGYSKLSNEMKWKFFSMSFFIFSICF